MPIWLREKLFQKNLLLNELKKHDKNFIDNNKILFSEHHLSHAASAFYPSPFEEAIVLTADGVGLPPELIALALALSLYTATFIAECVRAGVQGIGKGQKEAAASIGLTPNQVLKLVVMPQALRIIIPPTTNQYLNLTKNSSLAAAIAYPDLVLVFAGTALMQTGRAIEIVSITMLTYLSLSITISIFMNWYNKKIAIKEK